MQKFFDQDTTFPFLGSVKTSVEDIRAEIRCLRTWYEWPEKNLSPPTGKFQWHVIPLYGFGVWASGVGDIFPKTVSIIKDIPGLRTAIFSRLGPGSVIKPHYGWADLANGVLRCHLGLCVADGCGIWVEGERRDQKEGEWLVFDDSRLHSGYNMGSKPRIVLLLDIDRPEGIPRGTSTWVQTAERDEFVKYFSTPHEHEHERANGV